MICVNTHALAYGRAVVQALDRVISAIVRGYKGGTMRTDCPKVIIYIWYVLVGR